MTEKIKSLSMQVCPCCGGKVYVVTEQAPVFVSDLISPEEVTSAKDKVKKAIEDSDKLTIEDKAEALKRLADDATIFLPEEVSDIIIDLLGGK